MKTSRRKWWLAGLLSIFIFGLGQVYNGQLKKGILFYVVNLMISLLVLLCIRVIMGSSRTFFIISFILLLVTLFAVHIYMIADAIVYAWRQKDSYQLKVYNRWYIYLVAILLSSFILRPILVSALRENLFEAYMVPSYSMIPTIRPWDCIFVDKTVYRSNLPLQTDIIVVNEPRLGKRFARRVIGLPGDTIEIINKQVFINGKLLDESYAIHTDDRIMRKSVLPIDNYGPIIVPDSHIFVLGDNRDNSLDSRILGSIGINFVKGKVSKIYLSWDSTKWRIRWQRIGQTVQ